MAKSLSETAKAILMKESHDSTPDQDAKNTNPNSATLKPGSKFKDGRFANPRDASKLNSGVGEGVPQRWIPPDGQESHDETQPVVSTNDSQNIGAIVSRSVSKDTSASSQSTRKTAPAEKSASAEAMEEEFEISEELQDFIQEKMAEGLTEDQIAEAIEENFEMVSEDTLDEDTLDEVESTRSAKDARQRALIAKDVMIRKAGQSIIAMGKSAYKKEMGKSALKKENDSIKEDYQLDMSEHIEALLQGEDLSEEFKDKATTIFEAAVQQKVEEELVKIQEAYAETLEEQVQEITENLSSNVDDYLNYVVEQWVTENEVAIENGLRTELTEDFITGLRQLFAENYIDIPEDKVSVVEELGSKVAELETKLNEEIDRNVHLNRTLGESKQFEVLVNACDGLTDTQAEKLKTLSEGVEFTSEGEFAKKIKTLRENYFPIQSTGEGNLALDRAEVESSPDGRILNENLQGPMARYVQTLGRKLPN